MKTLRITITAESDSSWQIPFLLLVGVKLQTSEVLSRYQPSVSCNETVGKPYELSLVVDVEEGQVENIKNVFGGQAVIVD